MRDSRRLRRRTEQFVTETVYDIQKSGLAFGVPDNTTGYRKGSLLHLLANGVLEQRGTGVKPRLLNLVSLVSIAFGENEHGRGGTSFVVFLGADTAWLWLDT